MTGADKSTNPSDPGAGGSTESETKKGGMVGEASKLDPAIVSALYVAHSDELRRFLVGMLRDTQLANDALQAAFTKLVEQGHLTQESSRKGWLFRVAYNEAMLFRRRQAVGDRALRKVSWWLGEPSAAAADEPMVRGEVVEAVRSALHLLSSDQQQIVRMRIYEEKTFAVIARELKIPLGTALARMHAALAKLRERLKDR